MYPNGNSPPQLGISEGGFITLRTYAVDRNWVCPSGSNRLSLTAVNKPKVTAEVFINFLVATPTNATGMEVQRTNPVGFGEPSHDAYTRLLHRLLAFQRSALARGEIVGPNGLRGFGLG